MSQDEKQYHQQILFDESSIENKQREEQTAQVIFDNQDWLPEKTLEKPITQLPAESQKPRWLWRTIALLFAGLVSYELVSFFINGFNQSPIIASLYALLLSLLTIVVGRTAWREISSLRRLRQQKDINQRVTNILTQGSADNAAQLCARIAKQLPCDIAEQEQQAWQQIQHQQYTDVEVIQLFSRKVLSHADQKALAEVAKFSTESVVLVALSPLAVVDMMLIFWRNLRLVNKVAALYGLKLGYWSRLKLIKQVIINMAYAGASELAIDLGADLVGADMLGKLSTRMAQGLGAGMLTARLGIRTMQMCRPIPFQEDAPKLNQVRKEIISQVKTLMLK